MRVARNASYSRLFVVSFSSETEPAGDSTDDATRAFRRGPDDTKERVRFLGSLIEEALPPSEQIKMRLGDIMKPASARIAVTDQHADALLCDVNDWDEPAPEAKPPSSRSERPKPSWDRPIPAAPTTPTPLTFSAPSWPPPPTEWTPESERRVPSAFARREASDADIDVLIESGVPEPVAGPVRPAHPHDTNSPTLQIDAAAARRRKPYLGAALATFGFVLLGGASALVTTTYLSRAESRAEAGAPVQVGPPARAVAAKAVSEIPPRASEPGPAKPSRPSDAVAVEDLRLLPPEGVGTLAIGTHYDGHRVLVDGASIGRAPGFFKVRCGVRRVRVLATERSIDVPCGGEATFTPGPTH